MGSPAGAVLLPTNSVLGWYRRAGFHSWGFWESLKPLSSLVKDGKRTMPFCMDKICHKIGVWHVFQYHYRGHSLYPLKRQVLFLKKELR